MGQPAGWAVGVTLVVTALPREQRVEVKEMIQQAGGSYSPTLSRRCTHLAVPRSALDAGAGCSDKLRSALRHRSGGLQIVELSWVLRCAEARRRLDEASFLLPADLLAAATAAAVKEPAPATAVHEPMRGSWAGSKANGGSMLADTALSHDVQRQQRQPDHLRASCISRPLGSFSRKQPQPAAASLQTQLPSVKHSMPHSVHWGQANAAGTAGEVTQASSTRSAAAAGSAKAVLPSGVEMRQRQTAAAIGAAMGGCAPEQDYSRLPMTQAGFMPTTDLLQQLHASTLASFQPQPSLAAGAGAPTPGAAGAVPGMLFQHCGATAHRSGFELQQAVRIWPRLPAQSADDLQAVPNGQPQPQEEQQWLGEARAVSGAASAASTGGDEPCAAARSSQPDRCSKQQQQVQRQSQQEQQYRQGSALSTADLLEQLRRSATSSSMPQTAAEHTGSAGQQLQIAASCTAPPTTEVLLQQMRAAPGAAPATVVQPQRQPTMAMADLLIQLRASRAQDNARGAGQPLQQPQQGMDGTRREEALSTEALLRQLRTSMPKPAACTHQQASCVAGEQPPVSAVPASRTSAVSAAQLAAKAPHQQQQKPQQRPPLQQVQVQVQAPALESILAREQPEAGRHSVSTADLLQQLLQQRQQEEQQRQEGRRETMVEGMDPAPADASLGPSPGSRSPVPAAVPASSGAGASLLLQLQQLAQQDSFTPLKQQQQRQRQRQQQQASPCAKQQLSPQRAASTGTLTLSGGRQPAASAAATAAVSAALAPLSPSTALTAVLGGSNELECLCAPDVALTGNLEQGSAQAHSGSSRLAPAVEAASSRHPPPQLAAQGPGSQVSESGSGGGGLFAGILAILDPELPFEERQRVSALLEQGGGRVASSGALRRDTTHVVCLPEAALKWLAMGVGIVSPQWLLQSLRSGRQQRCLTLSADASRFLPAAPPATPAIPSPSEQPPSGHAGGGARERQDWPSLSSELLSCKQARQEMLEQLAPTADGAAGSGCGHGCASQPAQAPAAAHQQAALPAQLLIGLLWSVLDPPSAARLEGQQPRHQPAMPLADMCGDDELVIPDSEEEEEAEAEEKHEEEEDLFCISASQAAVQHLIQQAAASASEHGSSLPAAAAGPCDDRSWPTDVVLRGVGHLTLLLPRDARGDLGLDTLSVSLGPRTAGGGCSQPRQLTAAELLQLLHDYYCEEISSKEQLHLLQRFPAAQAVVHTLRPAFLELAAVPRGSLLGPRCSFEGLRKATRDPAGAVYELQLGS